MITIIKSPFRKYGYSLYYAQKQPYLYDGHTSGWYRYKRDATKRADELNKKDKYVPPFEEITSTQTIIKNLPVGWRVFDLGKPLPKTN